jgi:hypothetical protein
MSDLVFNSSETILNTASPSKTLSQMKNGSVIFEFYNGMRPIACDLDFLYAETWQYPSYSVHNLEKGRDGSTIYVLPNGDDPDNPSNRSKIKYKFLDVIKDLSFKYGLKNEYYKNKYGKWVNIGIIRPYFSLKNSVENIFGSMVVGSINNDIKSESLYVKLCDSEYFEFSNLNSSVTKICEIKDLNVLPETDYFVKEPNTISKDLNNNTYTKYNNSAFRYHVGKADGSYEIKKCKQITFTNIEDDTLDNVSGTDSVRFSYKLYDYNSNTYPVGDFDSNNHHILEDLLLTFVDKDGNDYTDLTNLFIIVNGVIVDYTPGPGQNQICLRDVVRYASYQRRGLKNGYPINQYKKIINDEFGTPIIDIDLPNESLGMTYYFDISIHKWENVSISHFIKPYNTQKLLKTKPEEPSKSYWLETGLIFSDSYIDKEKSILLCGNTIVEKDSWDIDKYGVIHLNSVSTEFDILYAEIYDKIQRYITEMYGHTGSNAPKLSDYLEGYTDSADIEEQYQKYITAIENWLATGEDKYHYSKSPFEIVCNQFNTREYAIIKFDTIEEKDYIIKLYENTSELKLNNPTRNTFRNINWTPDDIVVMNGLVHKFVNKYSDVFEAPLKWYRPTNEGVFDDVYAYKLEICKHYLEHDKFRRLSYGELLNGVKENIEYYIKSPNNNEIYLKCDDLTEFEFYWNMVSETEKSLGVDPTKTYFIYDNGEYIKVNGTLSDFDVDTVYYTKVFKRDYFILKK